MRGVVDEGTGAAIRQRYGIQADVAGKTGTTQDNSDGWFILMHPQLVAGAWVGFNDNRVDDGSRGARARAARCRSWATSSSSRCATAGSTRRPSSTFRARGRRRRHRTSAADDPLMNIFNDVLGRILRQLQ